MSRLPSLREAGLVGALMVPVDAFDRDMLRRCDRGVPLLLLLTAARSRPMASWAAVRALLSGCRSATLRVAAIDVPPCRTRPGRFDLEARWLEPETSAAGSFAPGCVDCAARSACLGSLSQWAIDSEVVPFPVAVSNQFDYVEIDADRADEISATSSNQLATLAIREGERLRYFELSADGWDDADIECAVGERSQVYLDLTDKARLDDFANDLRALHRLPGPAGAGEASAPIWQPAETTPFAAEEAELMTIIAALRGTVVDVGAGPVRYLRQLNEAITTGQVRYMAVEPDPGHLAQTAAEMPAALLTQGVGEALPVADDGADAVLMLRSYNHLCDVERALAEAARVLRPGGTLLLVDNVAFALARSRAQIARARQQPVSETPFEHYRNSNGDEAAAFVVANGHFTVEQLKSVRAGTSNQWMLVARRNVAGPSSTS